MLEWTRVVGPLIISWPLIALAIALIFRTPLFALLDRFTSAEEGSTAELGPLKLALGRRPVIPPQYRIVASSDSADRVDLASHIGPIRDSGPEGTTVGFAIAYAAQAEISIRSGQRLALSPRSIYVVARRFDEWSGEDYEGTSVEGGLKGLREVGAYAESDWPYAQKSFPPTQKEPVYRITGYRELSGVGEIMNALRERHVVVASIQVTEDFDSPSTDGVVTIKLPLREIGGKAIAIVGYDADNASFTFANDWGTSWGRNGFGVLRDTDLARVLGSAYAIER